MDADESELTKYYRKFDALDVELAGEVVADYKTFLSCDLNIPEFIYDEDVYNTFKSYPHSFARCLFEMGRSDLV